MAWLSRPRRFLPPVSTFKRDSCARFTRADPGTCGLDQPAGKISFARQSADRLLPQPIGVIQTQRTPTRSSISQVRLFCSMIEGMMIQVFIEAEAGSSEKSRYDE